MNDPPDDGAYSFVNLLFFKNSHKLVIVLSFPCQRAEAALLLVTNASKLLLFLLSLCN